VTAREKAQEAKTFRVLWSGQQTICYLVSPKNESIETHPYPPPTSANKSPSYRRPPARSSVFRTSSTGRRIPRMGSSMYFVLLELKKERRLLGGRQNIWWSRKTAASRKQAYSSQHPPNSGDKVRRGNPLSGLPAVGKRYFHNTSVSAASLPYPHTTPSPCPLCPVGSTPQVDSLSSGIHIQPGRPSLDPALSIPLLPLGSSFYIPYHILFHIYGTVLLFVLEVVLNQRQADYAHLTHTKPNNHLPCAVHRSRREP
jgi:hypothetical protein